MSRIAGFNHSVGEYEGKHYDNYNFVVFDKNENENRKWSFVKVKNQILINNNINPKDLVNQEVEFTYDKYGGVKGFIIDHVNK